MRYSVFLGMTYSLKCSEDSFTGTKVRAGIAMGKIPASAVCCKAISAKTGECSHKIEAHGRVHRIWTAARNEAVFFAYRVGMPHHRSDEERRFPPGAGPDGDFVRCPLFNRQIFAPRFYGNFWDGCVGHIGRIQRDCVDKVASAAKEFSIAPTTRC